MKRETNFSKYSKDELISIATRQERENKELKTEIQEQKHLVSSKNKKIKELESQMEKWLDIEENMDKKILYNELEHLKTSHKVALEVIESQKRQLEDEARIKSELQRRLSRKQPGRPETSIEVIEAVKKAKRDNPNLSTRKLSKALEDKGIKISHNKISKILKCN